MSKKQNSKTTKKAWLKPGHIQFLVILPPELATLFEAEMVAQDRGKLPLARMIIRKYFEESASRKEFEEFKQFRSRREPPHFGDEPDSGTELDHRQASR